MEAELAKDAPKFIFELWQWLTIAGAIGGAIYSISRGMKIISDKLNWKPEVDRQLNHVCSRLNKMEGQIKELEKKIDALKDEWRDAHSSTKEVLAYLKGQINVK